MRSYFDGKTIVIHVSHSLKKRKYGKYVFFKKNTWISKIITMEKER